MRVAASSVILLFLAASGAMAQNRPARTITVSGQGAVTAAPNFATIDLGVVTSAKTVQAALQQNNLLMTKVVASVKKTGVAEADMQTTQFTIEPEHPRNPRTGDEDFSKIVGYSVSNKVTAIVRKLSLVADVIDSATQAGANSANSVAFLVKDRAKLEDQAKTKAMQDARHQAEVLAAAEGAKVGKVVNISTASTDFGPPPMAILPKFRASPATPILPGEVGISASATVQYELQ
jgi:uncharacterized protein YggE